MKSKVDIGLYHGHTNTMKTAVSIPDRLFEKAEALAKELGIARSQLYARAIEQFVSIQSHDRITKSLNDLYKAKEEPLTNDIGLVSLRELTKNDTW
jgi:predicted DNA-binding protein